MNDASLTTTKAFDLEVRHLIPKIDRTAGGLEHPNQSVEYLG
jgi:hypothetical protein